MESENLTGLTLTVTELSRCRRLERKLKIYIRKNCLLILTLGGVLVGFALGFGLRETTPSDDALLWLGFPGVIFLRMLKMMILPLIICSVISGSASLDPKSNGKISAVSFVFIVSTNTLACMLAIFLSLVIKPGQGGQQTNGTQAGGIMGTQDIFADLLRNIFPDNIVEACFRQTQTQYKQEPTTLRTNSTNTTMTEAVMVMTKQVGKTDGANVLGLILICSVIGIAASTLKGRGKPFLKFFTAATDIVLVVLRWFLWMTPLGILSLIAVSIASIENIQDVFQQLGLFVVTVTVGTVIQQLLLLPAILFLLTRRNPYTYILSIAPAWMLAFASTSTAVAIPEMISACENKQNIDKRVARFVIPFCVTLNADGSALYISSAAIFVGYLTGIPLTVGDIIVIGVLTSVASMALPSVPSSSIVTLVMILTSLNIPADDIALLFAVEWFLDRIRTTTNVVSHTFCAAVTYRFCKKDLIRLDEKSTIEDEIIVIPRAVTQTSYIEMTEAEH